MKEDIYFIHLFEKIPGIFRFLSLSPLEFHSQLGKMKLHTPETSQKLCYYTHSNFQTLTHDENSFFLITDHLSWKFHYFFSDPWNFPILFFQYPCRINSVSHQPPPTPLISLFGNSQTPYDKCSYSDWLVYLAGYLGR